MDNTIRNPDSIICLICSDVARIWGRGKSFLRTDFTRIYHCRKEHFTWEDGKSFSIEEDFTMMEYLLNS